MRNFLLCYLFSIVAFFETHSFAETGAERLIGTWEASLEKDLVKVASKAFSGNIGKPLTDVRVWPWEETKSAKVSLVIDVEGQCKMTLHVAGKDFVRRQTWRVDGFDGDTAAITIASDDKKSSNQIVFHGNNRFQLKGELIDGLFAKSPVGFSRTGVYDSESAQRYLVGRWRSEFIVDEARIRNLLQNKGLSDEEVNQKMKEQVARFGEMSFLFTFHENGQYETSQATGQLAEKSTEEWKLHSYRKSQPPFFPYPELVYQRTDDDGDALTDTLEIIDQDSMITRRFDKLPIRGMVLRREKNGNRF